MQRNRKLLVCRDVNFVMEERKMKLVKAEITDIEEISKLYDDVCDYLFEHENYPGWKKHIRRTNYVKDTEESKDSYDKSSVFGTC